jgi:hypothetical protein
MSKLTDHQIEQIQTLYAIGYPRQTIARAFNVTNTAVKYHTGQIRQGHISLTKVADIIMTIQPPDAQRIQETIRLREMYPHLAQAA